MYDTTNDFSESTDQAEANPDRVKQMTELWWQEAEANDVMPLDDRTLVDIINFRQPNGLMALPKVTLYSGQGHVPQYSMITATERSMGITAHFSEALYGQADGVLLASGEANGGYTLYIKNGTLCFEHVYLGRRDITQAFLPKSLETLTVVIHVADDDSATVQLFADRKRIGRGNVVEVANHLSFWGIDVGRDGGSQVSDAYTAPFEFPKDRLDRIEMTFFEDATAEDIAALLEATE
ncbi:MAG: hypothetical protein E8G75_02135 [Sulfitobacter sp. SK025]|nr:MAG: hypothetical protein E8G75_02135 [Sulfitobacter sp. SK025]